MHEDGATAEHFAAVAVTARAHAALHPGAQMRDPITVADVLASRLIADPLRLLDCSLVRRGGGGDRQAARRGWDAAGRRGRSGPDRGTRTST
jgi:acetyl-CoA acetyltransferase